MLTVVLIVILALFLPAANAQETLKQPKKSTTIVLDPGHGGLDVGAGGPENVTEKDMAMAFARVMTERLKASYRVVLTRKDDYQVSLFDRTSLANHQRADLYVSIHTGASFRSNPRGISIFYYEGAAGNADGRGFQAEIQAETSRTIQPWELPGHHFISKSRYFAELLKKRLSQAYEDLEIASGGAPLIVLAGIRMPAVLVEIGHVTNPMDVRALKDESQLSVLAGHVCDAIDDFFQTI